MDKKQLSITVLSNDCIFSMADDTFCSLVLLPKSYTSAGVSILGFIASSFNPPHYTLSGIVSIKGSVQDARSPINT